MRTFLENNRIVRAAGSAVAGQSNIVSDTIDIRSFERITFIALLGDVATGGLATMTLHMGNDPTGATNEAVSQSVTADESGAMVALEFYRPLGRYAHVVIERTGGDVGIDGIVCILSEPHAAPVANDALADAKILKASTM
jgi:hypothetical protein